MQNLDFCVIMILRRVTTPSLRAVKYFRLPFAPEGSLLFVQGKF